MKHTKQLIYKHTNKINGHAYVGQTANTMEERLRDHLYSAKKGAKWSFQKAIRKYGIENFTHEILEDNIHIQSNLKTKMTLANEREMYWIDFYDTYNNGYNETIGGGSIMLGRKHSKKTIKKMKKPKSEEHIHNLIKNHKGMSGRKHTLETKEIMRQTALNMTAETKKKISNSSKGKPKSEEHNIKNSEAKKGKKHPGAKIIGIFDSNGNKMFSSHGDFEKVCKENNLPFGVLSNSYKNDGSGIYLIKSPRNPENLKFKGWYAKVITSDVLNKQKR